MNIFLRVLGIILFTVFFGFALKNTHEVTLQFFLGYEIRGPLVLLLLGFFAAGFVFGVLAMTPTVFRTRRDLNQIKKKIADMQKELESKQTQCRQPPQPDSIALR